MFKKFKKWLIKKLINKDILDELFDIQKTIDKIDEIDEIAQNTKEGEPCVDSEPLEMWSEKSPLMLSGKYRVCGKPGAFVNRNDPDIKDCLKSQTTPQYKTILVDCPKCEGIGCEFCLGTGVIPKPK